MLKVLAVDRPLPAYQSTFPDARPAARASQRPTPAPATVVPVQATPPQTEAAKASPQPQASAPPAPPAVENEEEVLDLVMDAEPAGEEPAPPRVAAPQVAAAAPDAPAPLEAPAALDAPAPLEAPVARTAPADQVPQASPPARVAPDAPSPAPEPEPPNVAESLQASAGADDDGGDFFDLAAAIERELSVDAECVVDTPVVDDGGKEVDTITGIRQAIDQQVGADDFQTHYQLGIAFKEMGLLDEAIGEFQQAARDPDSFMTCCSMLGLCFREKGMPQIAEKWYRKGLDKGGTGDSADEHALGLLYDMGTLHQEQGRHEEARNCFVEVYASNANYLDVATRLKLLSAEPDETAPRAGR
jgi:tetratricopeptide (TPR) repeat protein